MVAGFNMFSFDLFGLGRKAQEQTLQRENELSPEPKSNGEADVNDRDQEHELFFWSLYPVI